MHVGTSKIASTRAHQRMHPSSMRLASTTNLQEVQKGRVPDREGARVRVPELVGEPATREGPRQLRTGRTAGSSRESVVLRSRTMMP